MTKIYTLLSLGLFSSLVQATCHPETDRFEQQRLKSTSQDILVVNDHKTRLQWMQCPLGKNGDNCHLGSALLLTPEDIPDEIRTFNQQQDTAFQGWRLPTPQELLTITDQSCRYGTYQDVFQLSVPYTRLDDIYQQVETDYTDKIDTLYSVYQSALTALNTRRARDAEADENVSEWLQNMKQSYDTSLSEQERDQLYTRRKTVLEPWLEQHVAEWPVLRDAKAAFGNAARHGHADSGLASLFQFYNTHRHEYAQKYATDGDLAVKFNTIPEVSTYHDRYLAAGYGFTNNPPTIARYIWGTLNVRLVRTLKQSKE